MRHKSFVVFILSHGRASNVKTLKTLKRAGYTGKVLIVIDNEDPLEDDYKRIYGESNVVVFGKMEASTLFDVMDNYDDSRGVVYARNVCFDIAEKMGYEYFLELDDDYTLFEFRTGESGKLKSQRVNNMDKLLDAMLDFLDVSGAYTVAFAQGGDLIGGTGNGNYNKKLLRKAMNSFFCRTDRRFVFDGRINEDTVMYCKMGTEGKLVFTYTDVDLVQTQTQKQKGGLTEQYLDIGTYVKSFYAVMCCPGCVTIGMMGGSKRGMRLHHMISWNNCAPKIISEKYKKQS